jgi:hypothetical protein
VADNRLDVSGSAFMLRAHHVPSFLRVVGEGPEPATIAEIVSIPAAATYVRRLGARVHLAAGVFVPSHTDYTLRASRVTRAGSQWVNTETLLDDDTHAGVGQQVTASNAGGAGDDRPAGSGAGGAVHGLAGPGGSC